MLMNYDCFIHYKNQTYVIKTSPSQLERRFYVYEDNKTKKYRKD